MPSALAISSRRSRKVDRVELPRAGAGGIETALRNFRPAVHWNSFSAEIHYAFVIEAIFLEQ
jgi:hypothetical protein